MERSSLHTLTLAVFLLGVVGQGFSPCPHHASLDPSGHVPPAAFTGSIQSEVPNGQGTLADSESEDHEGICSCLKGCDVGSGVSLPSGQFHPGSSLATAFHVVDGPGTSLLDARPNSYLVPLPQPPPYSS